MFACKKKEVANALADRVMEKTAFANKVISLLKHVVERIKRQSGPCLVYEHGRPSQQDKSTCSLPN